MTGGTSSVNTSSLTIVAQPPGSDGSATAATTSSTGIITFTPTSGAAGTFSLTFAYCAPGDTYSTGSPNCTTALLTYEPAIAQDMGDAVTVTGIPFIGTETTDTYQTVYTADVGPTSVRQNSTFTLTTAPAASTIPSSEESGLVTVDDAYGLTAIIPVPSGLTYVPGSIQMTGGDANTYDETSVQYCTASGTGCTAQIDTGNYKTNYPYVETQLASSVKIGGGNNVTLPTVSIQFTATGSVGSVQDQYLTEFVSNTDITVLGADLTAVFDAYPTSGSDTSETPPYADPTLLGSTTITAPLPTITNVNPTSGTTAGETSVTITGTGFYGGGSSSAVTAVDFGATSAAGYTVNSDTEITANSPPESVGTVDITVTTSVGTSDISSADQFTYVLQSQTITVTSTAPSSPTVGDTYTPTATASSGLTVAITIDSTTTGNCSISGGLVTFNAAGSCVIDFNQAGDSNYDAAPQVQQTMSVGQGSQTITITSTAPSSPTIGDTYTPTATASSGLMVAITIDSSSSSVCSISGGLVTFNAEGNCVIDANQAGDSNYDAAPQVQQTVESAWTPRRSPSPPPPRAARRSADHLHPHRHRVLGASRSRSRSTRPRAHCSISGGLVTFNAAGNCVSTSTRPATPPTPPHRQVQQTYGVGQGSQTITVTSTAPTSPAVGDTYTPTATASSGLTVDDHDRLD